MTKTGRVTLFLLTLIFLGVIFLVTNGRVCTSLEQSAVIFSALVMLSFVTLFLEHFFTTPTDVIASTIAILLLLAPLQSHLLKMGRWYWLFFGYNLFLLATSLTVLLLLDQNKSATTTQNQVSSVLKKFSVYFGNGRFLFFVLLFLTLVFYADNRSPEFLAVGAAAAVILLIDPKEFILSSWKSRRGNLGLDIGQIIGVQSRNTFLAKLYTERVPVRRFDTVEFRYSMDETHSVYKGLIVDNFLLNEQQWIKILSTDDIRKGLGSQPETESSAPNVVFKLQKCTEPEFLTRFVGVVVDESNIMKLRFDYGERVKVTEGNLLEAQVSGRKVLYQITQASTEIEALEHKDEAGLVVGECVQLGIWDPKRLLFEKFGWVPGINTPLFLASEAPAFTAKPEERQIGKIPGTNYPLLLNLHDTVTYHTAILGVTGSGKSVFCRDLLRKIIAEGTKVICVDFTNEYRTKFPDFEPENVIADAHKDDLFKAIDTLSLELEKFANQRNKGVMAAQEQILKDGFYQAVKEFIQSEKPLALFELPDVSNTTGILEYTKWFFRGLFQVARQDNDFGKKVCVVLEEAHTVIPEWNFIGVEEKKLNHWLTALARSLSKVGSTTSALLSSRREQPMSPKQC